MAKKTTKKTVEKTQKKNNYEGMFLLPAGIGDSERAIEAVGKQLDRIEAEVLSIKLWDERRLAYDVAGNKRGIYILTYFNADPSRITELEHDCQLDESILRVLVLRHDRLTKEQIEAPTPASHRPPEEKPAAEAPVEKEKPAAEAPVEKE